MNWDQNSMVCFDRNGRRPVGRWIVFALVVAPLLLATLGCGRAADEGPSPGTRYEAALKPLGDRPVRGQVRLTVADTSVQVSVTATGLAPDTTHPQHLHRGTCDQLGGVVVPLDTQTEAFPRADSTGALGYQSSVAPIPDSLQHRIIVVHGADGRPVACGGFQKMK